MIDVEVGSSSEDIRLKGVYRIKEDAWISGKDRAFYAKANTGDEAGAEQSTQKPARGMKQEQGNLRKSRCRAYEVRTEG